MSRARNRGLSSTRLSSVRFLRLTRYQSRLLKELAVTKDLAGTWRERIQNLLADAANIVNAAFLYIFLPGESGEGSIEVFWLREPTAAGRRNVETMLAKRRPDAAIRHTTVGRGAPETAARERSGARRDEVGGTFSLQLHGSVGMGLAWGTKLRPADRIAVDSTLTAVSVIMESVKALSAYTLDVERFATRDPLTGLYNQISFWDLLEYEASRSRRQQYKFSLLVIDLDNFKTVNDNFGHEIGDAILKAFSRILKNSVRSGDIAARYAGDQFAAILPVCDDVQAYAVARRVIDGLRDYAFTTPNGTSIRGTASVGVSVFPDHAQETRDLFLLADNMLSQAKSCGKDRLTMPGEHDSVQMLRRTGEKSIMILDALANKWIVPYFQPIMNVSDGLVEAYEVLTRIVKPGQVVTAAEFIETAEAMGAIGRIDYQLFEHALAKVRETGYAGNLFLNLSPKALILDEFMPTIRRLMRDYGLDPAKLIFEITERDTVKNIGLLERFISELKHDGFRFAIDDFGSGYSSFQYIKTFRIDFLKVDGEFIRHLTGPGTIEKHIVSSIASLAANLGIKTIAEYVESKDILDEVRAAGMDYAQGYFIRRPSPDLR